jgi:hypothetical protein
MRIDLDDYTPAMRRFIKTREMACVYVLSHRVGRPCRVGHCLDVHAHVGMIRSLNAALIDVNHLLWCPGKMVAVVVENAVRNELAGHHIRQKWFDLDPDHCTARITEAAARLYPGANLVTHDAIIRQLNRPQTPTAA